MSTTIENVRVQCISTPYRNVLQSLKAGAHNLLDFHNKVTTSETLISDYKVRSQVRNNVKSSLIMVYYLY